MLCVNYISIKKKKSEWFKAYINADQWEQAEFFCGPLGKFELGKEKEKK